MDFVVLCLRCVAVAVLCAPDLVVNSPSPCVTLDLAVLGSSSSSPSLIGGEAGHEGWERRVRQNP